MKNPLIHGAALLAADIIRIPGLSYRVANCADLITWALCSYNLTTYTAPADNGGATGSIAIRTVEPLDGTKRFLRLEVRQLP